MASPDTNDTIFDFHMLQKKLSICSHPPCNNKGSKSYFYRSAASLREAFCDLISAYLLRATIAFTACSAVA